MLLILVILFVTLFFCHALVRLCMLIMRNKTSPVDDPNNSSSRRRRRLPDMIGPGGYAIPRQPIRVVLARDEEAAGIESEATKTNPPAYGIWRESVVCTIPFGFSIYRGRTDPCRRESTPTASTGCATKPLPPRQWMRAASRAREAPVRRRGVGALVMMMARLVVCARRRCGHRRMRPTTASHMWWRRSRGRLRRRGMYR